jgi:hypothetical protein
MVTKKREMRKKIENAQKGLVKAQSNRDGSSQQQSRLWLREFDFIQTDLQKARGNTYQIEYFPCHLSWPGLQKSRKP